MLLRHALYLPLAVASGRQAEPLSERTHEARRVPIARRVCNFLNLHAGRYQHRSRYMEPTIPTVILHIDADFIFEQMTQPGYTDLASIRKFWERAAWILIQNLNHFLNPKILLTRPGNHTLTFPQCVSSLIA